MSSSLRFSVVLLLSLSCGWAAASEVFQRDVKPILAEHCVTCHGPDQQKSGLRLDHAARLMQGGDSGSPVVAGEPEASLLYQVVSGLHEDMSMPPKGEPLSEEEVATLHAWIADGAVVPETLKDEAGNLKSDHWAFQPIVSPTPPAISAEDWARNPIDQFVGAKLAAAGIEPAPEADPVTLVRRLYLDLLGLPPEPEEVDVYLNDPSPYRYEQLVSRLLASPHYGERWARHWLDLARYADSDGYEKDGTRPWAWRYRHWVIEALNRDLPYDQFIVEQIAGDLLPNADTEQLVATGFHRNTLTNKEGGVDQEEFRVAQVVDRTNTTMQALMGLTMACAQCHTHKYDPITHREYFSFYAFFNAGMEKNIPAPLDEEVALYEREKKRYEEQHATLKKELDARRDEMKKSLEDFVTGLDTTPIGWETLTPTAVSTASEAIASIEPDGSVTVSGDRPDKDTYTITVESKLAGITGFEVEALADEALPAQGPGRADNGNFVLSTFNVVARPFGTTSAPPENLALTAKASSPDGLDSDGGSSGDQAAIDGNPETFWDEQDNASEYRLRLDFEEPRAMSVLTLVGYKHESYAPMDFDIVCDDKVVRSVKSALYQDNFGVFSFPQTTCSRLELVITRAYGASPGIRELGVYDAKARIVREAYGPSEAVAFDKALASHEQGGFPAGQALDDEERGWAVGGGTGTTQAIRFLSAEPVGDGKNQTYVVTLRQDYGGGHTLGRFRIRATTDPRARLDIPDDVRTAAQKPADERSGGETNALLDYYTNFDGEYRERLARLRGLEAGAPKEPDTMAQAIVANPEPPETHIHLRGDFLSKGDKVEPGTPAVLPPLKARGDQPDRLDLARWIASPENPLTARVAVNRTWEKLFGVGLVRTPEDFGTRGEMPTHPKLLDWLATEFMARGWSQKDLIRTIVTSSTYRQSSNHRPAAQDQDPQNRLIARQGRFRVEAEIIRDLFLAASGLLNDAVGGPSIRPALPDSVADLSYASSVKYPETEGDAVNRRGLYVWFQRTIAFPMLMTFDCPDSNTTALRRNRSNTPLQALTLMNDPVFVKAARALADRIAEEGADDPRERVKLAFRLCMAREPKAAEVDALMNLLEEAQARYADQPEEAEKLTGESAPERAAFVTVARALMNADEFVTRE